MAIFQCVEQPINQPTPVAIPDYIAQEVWDYVAALLCVLQESNNTYSNSNTYLV